MKKDGGLAELFRKHIPTAHWQRVENIIGRGTPDMNGCLKGKEFWIEFKKTDGWRIDIKPEQVAWHLHRSRVGGKTFFAVRRDPKCLDELWIISGRQAALLKRSGIKALKTGYIVTSGGPRRWDWGSIQSLLAAQ